MYDSSSNSEGLSSSTTVDNDNRLNAILEMREILLENVKY